ncbi:MAG: hypothetical protein K9K38_22850 [Rhodoferax sp.]|nr:hypothetical protein [Rhodoferax sp.]
MTTKTTLHEKRLYCDRFLKHNPFYLTQQCESAAFDAGHFWQHMCGIFSRRRVQRRWQDIRSRPDDSTWVTVQAVQVSQRLPALFELDRGERDTLLLAFQQNNALVLMD